MDQYLDSKYYNYMLDSAKKGQGILGIVLGCFFELLAILFTLASSSRKLERKNEKIEKSHFLLRLRFSYSS